MNSLFESLNVLQAAPAGGSGQMVTTLIMFGMVFLIFYFLIIRPQNKRQKETKQMLEKLKKGDKIQTIGGIRGKIDSVNKESVIVVVDDNTKMEFVRSAIANVITDQKPADSKADSKKEKDSAKEKADK